jgi:hypothetical protein
MLNRSVRITELYEITDDATGAATFGSVTLEEAQAEAAG